MGDNPRRLDRPQLLEIRMTDVTQPPEKAVALSGTAAARLTGVSAKTLARRALKGEPLGRIKIGRRVLYHRVTLEAWLASKAK